LEPREVAAPQPDSASTKVISDVTPPSRAIDRSLAQSLAWRAVSNWGSQIVSWASFLLVVRLLSPADFGIAAMAVILWPYLRYMGEFGIGQAVVTLRDLTQDQLAQLNSLAVMLGLGCFGLGALLAKPLAMFFRTPALAPVVIVTCTGLLPLSFRAVPEGLLAKDMRFKLLASFEATLSVVSAVVTLFLAYSGMGYWALVLGNLAGYTVRSVLILFSRPCGFALPDLKGLRRPLLFGWHVLVSVIAWSAYERLDNLTAGRVLGQAALGFYGMAWNLANVPLEKLTSLVTTVLPTYLAAAQKEPAALRRYLRTLTEALALATFPATIGLALVANEVVPLVLGRKWQPAVLPLQILAVYTTFRSIVALLPKVLTALGNPRFVMWNDLRALIILPTAFYIGSRWGIAGIAWGWVAAYPLVALPLYWKTFRTIEMNPGEYIRGLRPAVDGVLMMALAVGAVKWGISPRLPMVARLVLESVTGVIVYASAVFVMHRTRVLTFMRQIKNVRQANA
jgi:PST family polysaccharide transporter